MYIELQNDTIIWVVKIIDHAMIHDAGSEHYTDVDDKTDVNCNKD